MAEDNEKCMSFWEHLEDLRWTLIKIISVFVLFTAASAFWNDELFDLMMMPLGDSLAEKKIILNQSGPFDGIFIKMKMTMLSGLIFSAPFALIFLWGFIAPALRAEERKIFWKIFAVFLILFAGGLGIGYFSLFAMIPILLKMGVSGADNIWRLNDYVSFFLFWELCSGFLMETPLLVFALVRLGIAEPSSLKKWRPYVFLFMFLLSAAITADPVSLILLGFFSYALYELGIFAASLHKQR